MDIIEEIHRNLGIEGSTLKIIQTFFELRSKIDLFLKEIEVKEKNLFGEYSRGFDLEVSKFFIEKLRGLGFTGTIITEELLSDGDRECIFIDPIDGSLNASRGIKMYGFTLGYSEKCSTKTKFGLVWLIPQDKIFLGSNEKVLSIEGGHRISILKKKFEKNDPDILVETGDMAGTALEVIKNKFSIRHFGSIAYSFYLMISGKLDGLIDTSGKLKFTDVAGFVPIMDNLDISYRIVLLRENIRENPRIMFVASPYKDVFSVFKEVLDSVS